MHNLMKAVARSHPARSLVLVGIMTAIPVLFQLPADYVAAAAIATAGVMFFGGPSASRFGSREPDDE